MGLFSRKPKSPPATQNVVYVVTEHVKLDLPQTWLTTRLYFETELTNGRTLRDAVVDQVGGEDILIERAFDAIRPYPHRIAVTWRDVGMSDYMIIHIEAKLVAAVGKVVAQDLRIVRVNAIELRKIIDQRRLFEATHPREPKLEWDRVGQMIY